MPTVVLIGTLDTKGIEFRFLKKKIEAEGCDVIVVDAGILGKPQTRLGEHDVSRKTVALAAGVDLGELQKRSDRGAAVMAMARGAEIVVKKLFAERNLDAVMSMGGSGNSSIASQAMRALPIGVPKLIVSTLASGDTRPFVGNTDITMMYSVVDIAGINRLSERILTNAATAIAGMAKSYASRKKRKLGKPLIGATMFGVTTPAVTAAREWLEAKGYEVLVFHATGTGGQSMEQLVNDGFLAGVLDVTTTEWADEFVGGVLSAGPHRLEAAGLKGVPQVISLGALDMVNFGPIELVPEKFKHRNLYQHNATVTLMRTTADECAQLGRILAEKINRSIGKTAVFIPRKGISMIAVKGKPFYDPDADRALFDNLKANLRNDIPVYEFDTDINDALFAQAMAMKLHEFISKKRKIQN
jgi:uncharacterized protein (UPF0261 family)